MGLKYLLLIGAIAGVVLLLRSARNRRLDKPSSQARDRTGIQAARMVRCARCGLHVPEREAVRRGEDLFCSVDHADLGKPST